MDIEAIKDEQGDLPAYAWPGGYPLYYLAGSDNDILCPRCANSETDNVTAYGANWEDPMLICDDCNERIESAYAEDEITGAQAVRELKNGLFGEREDLDTIMREYAHDPSTAVAIAVAVNTALELAARKLDQR